MILAWLDISINLVVIAHVVVSLLLILVILMQRPKQEGLGAAFGSGMTDAAWGARTTDVLQKGTVYLGTLFFVFSLILAILFGKRNAIEGKRADADGASTPQVEEPAVPTPEPEEEAADPAAEFEKELEELKKDEMKTETPAPETPPAETAPETPAEEDSPEGAESETPAEETVESESPKEDVPAPAGE